MRRVVVSIHDVAPGTLEEVRYLLERLDGIGVRRRVLKVIPHDPEGGDLRRHDDLLATLGQEVRRGNETVVHGFTHRVEGRLRGPWLRTARARLFATEVAEFLSIDQDEAARRLRAGRAALLEAGLTADGFCAPAWLAPAWLDQACAQAGFRYVVRMASLAPVAGRRRKLTPWIGYLGASRVQERLVGAGNRACRLGSGLFPVIKVFLHPQGARGSPACDRVLGTLVRLTAGRTASTYADLIA